ncbi:MAG: hypothetical protein ACXW3Z_15135 [Limisphaerales bacterium]
MNTINTPTKSRKPRSKFALLPAEDQKRIIDLCDQHTYHEALDIIAQPRPEGLQLQSSYGALVRFYASYSKQARTAHLLGQSARTVQLTRQAHPGALRGAILTMVESRIYEALRRDVPVSELSTEFAILKDFHKGFLSEEKWRTQKDSTANSDWSLHLSSTPNPQKDDFVPVDEHGNPTEPEPLTEADLTAVSELDPNFEDKALAKLDYTIAARGRDAAQRTGALYGFSYSFVEQRIEAYKQQLRQRGISAAQGAIEARAAALKKPRVLQDTPDKSTIIQSQPPANPHDSLIST